MGLNMQANCRKLFAIYLVAACAHFNWAAAQNITNIQGKPVCTAAKDIRAPQMYGLWQVTFTNPPRGLPASATLMLEKHEEFGDSVQGVVTRTLPARSGASATSNLKAGHAGKAAIAGDVEDGFVILDESSNNTSISGAWNGQIVEGSCGREVTGLWKDTSASAGPNAHDVPFTLRRLSGW